MKYSRSLVATLLMSGGLLQLAPAVLADGTAAGQSIDNTATATYEQAGSATPINTTSNTVTVTVAEIAGVTVQGVGAPTGIGTSSSQIVAGNNLYYNFAITNVGNFATQFHIPGIVTISGPGTKITTNSPSGVEYSEDNGVTWIPVPVAGLDTAKVGGTAVGDRVLIRVAINVNSNPGTSLDVRLGNGANNSTNENFVGSGFNDDVYTVPLAGRTPANIKRESSASVLGPIGSTANNVAFATVLETRTGENQNNTPAIRSDDTISYKLELKVGNSAPVGTTPAALAGADINVGGTTTKRILVSNAVPGGTLLVDPGTSPVPSGWTRVYTSSLTSVNANDAVWSTTFNAAANRIGFVSNINATVLPGDTVTNLTFSVKVQGADLAAGTSYNVDSIAQAFGSSLAGSTALIYDESGDQTSNNSSTNAVPTVSSGVAQYTVGNADINNDNNLTGANAGNGPSATSGEVNRFTWTYNLVATTGLLNGPFGVPGAVGPGNSLETDFTNKSTSVAANKVAGTGATIDPNVVGFDNTVKNTGSATANIKLLPTILAAGTLPENTKVRIYDGATNQSATYKLNASGNFVFVDNAQLTVASDVLNSGNNSGGAVSATNPVTLDGVLSTGTKGYAVAVTLPPATPLSTDTLSGYPVVINAFTTATLATATPAAGTTNATIDRVYTGFMKLTKEARILKGIGPNVVSGANFSDANTTKKPEVGNYIEYRIVYKNISEPQVGNGNAILEANNLVIVEDGTGTNGSGSSWGKDADGNGTVDTIHVLNSATDPDKVSPIEYFGGSTATTPASNVAGVQVTKYIDRVSTVAPGTTGTFTFQREVK